MANDSGVAFSLLFSIVLASLRLIWPNRRQDYLQSYNKACFLSGVANMRCSSKKCCVLLRTYGQRINTLFSKIIHFYKPRVLKTRVYNRYIQHTQLTDQPMVHRSQTIPWYTGHRPTHSTQITDQPMVKRSQTNTWYTGHRPTHGTQITDQPMVKRSKTNTWYTGHRPTHGLKNTDQPIAHTSHTN